jgi:hypothetical protein
MNVHVCIYIYYKIIYIYKYAYIMGVISLQPFPLRFEISPGASRCGAGPETPRNDWLFLRMRNVI